MSDRDLHSYICEARAAAKRRNELREVYLRAAYDDSVSADACASASAELSTAIVAAQDARAAAIKAMDKEIGFSDQDLAR